MIVLGIDPATKCGWAVLDGTELVASGTWRLGAAQGGSGARFLAFQRALDAIVREYEPDMAVIERPGKLQGDAILILNGLVALFAAYAEERGLEYRAVSPTEVKRAAGCTGGAGKLEVMAAVNGLYPQGAETRDDNECDAIAVAIAGAAFME